MASQPLALTWDTENDKLLIRCRRLTEASTKREMTSQLASQFDPLGMAAPFFLGGRLILQKVAASGVAWDDILPDDVQNTWRKWLATLSVLDEFSISCYCFAKSVDAESEGTAVYHSFIHSFFLFLVGQCKVTLKIMYRKRKQRQNDYVITCLNVQKIAHCF